jgi:hypothetical protein
MKSMKKEKSFIIKVPRQLYTKDLQRMFDFLRFRKATASSKASQKDIELLVASVQKSRNEKKQAMRYL